VAEPDDIPVTKPVVEPIVATAGLLLLQVPLPIPSLSVVVAPTHIFVLPVIAIGKVFTVTVAVALQPPPMIVE
jgi:hypothetical protein